MRDETPSVGIFISHGWYTSELYKGVVGALDSSRALKWVNHSIPEDKALVLSIEGNERRSEELALLKERKETLLDQLGQNEARVGHWNRWLRLDRLIRETRERVMDPQYAIRITNLEKELKEREAIGGIDGVQQELDSDIERRQHLQSDIARCDERLKETLNKNDGDLAVKMNSRAGHWLFTIGGKMHQPLIDNNLNLSLSIANRILRSDIFLVLANSFVMYRKWVEFEFEVASFSPKHIPKVGVLPPGESDLPRELRDRCDGVVHFDPTAIVSAVLRFSRS